MDFWWKECTWTVDHMVGEVHTQDEVRALLPMWCSIHYLPKDELIEFYKEWWEEWLADPPEWFNHDFRSLLPRGLLAKVPENLWV